MLQAGWKFARRISQGVVSLYDIPVLSSWCLYFAPHELCPTRVMPTLLWCSLSTSYDVDDDEWWRDKTAWTMLCPPMVWGDATSWGWWWILWWNRWNMCMKKEMKRKTVNLANIFIQMHMKVDTPPHASTLYTHSHHTHAWHIHSHNTLTQLP